MAHFPVLNAQAGVLCPRNRGLALPDPSQNFPSLTKENFASALWALKSQREPSQVFYQTTPDMESDPVSEPAQTVKKLVQSSVMYRGVHLANIRILAYSHFLRQLQLHATATLAEDPDPLRALIKKDLWYRRLLQTMTPKASVKICERCASTIGLLRYLSESVVLQQLRYEGVLHAAVFDWAEKQIIEEEVCHFSLFSVTPKGQHLMKVLRDVVLATMLDMSLPYPEDDKVSSWLPGHLPFIWRILAQTDGSENCWCKKPHIGGGPFVLTNANVFHMGPSFVPPPPTLPSSHSSVKK